MNNQCTHRSFRPIYKAINFHQAFRRKKEFTFECERCGKRCKLHMKGHKHHVKPSVKRALMGLLWMLPAFIFVALFVNGTISPAMSIGLTLAYHFIAMYCIISCSSYVKVKEVSKK